MIRFRPPVLTADGRWSVTWWDRYWRSQDFPTLDDAAKFIANKLDQQKESNHDS